MLGFVVGITHATDIFINGFRRGGGHGFRSGVVAEERRGNHVDPFVRTLGGKYDCYQQLERVVVVQFGFSHGDCLFKISNDAVIEFLLFHFLLLFTGKDRTNRMP